MPKLQDFFASSLIYPDASRHHVWLSYEAVPLKWHYPLGLLHDLYSGAEPAYPSDDDVEEKHGSGEDEEQKQFPWKLTVHFSDYPAEQLVPADDEGKFLHDMYMNQVKEVNSSLAQHHHTGPWPNLLQADYLRTGTGKTVMFLSKEDSTQLWDSVKQHNFAMFNQINHKLLNPQGTTLRHIPIRLYLPHAASQAPQEDATPGSLRVVQALVTPSLSSRMSGTENTHLQRTWLI